MRTVPTTRPAAQTTTRRKPVRATTLADARATYGRAAMERAVEQMFTDRDLTREDF